MVAGVYKNEDKIKDKKGFASLVGGNVLILGLVFCVGGLGIYTFPGHKELIEPVLLLTLLAFGMLTYIKSKQYINWIAKQKLSKKRERECWMVKTGV